MCTPSIVLRSGKYRPLSGLLSYGYMHSLPERAMRSSMCRVFPPLLVGARRSSDPHADHYSFMPRPLLLQLQSSIASHRPPCSGELQLLLWRLLHHTALASLFATFGLGHLQEALPSPSFLTPCDYRMLQSQVK